MVENGFSDTIVAISSANGRSGIGVVRLSGRKSAQICNKITRLEPEHRKAYYTRFKARNGETIDSGVVLFFKGPNSYTGEDVLELQAHGNPIILNELVGRSIQLGARQARPGEFTERAFRNDKLSLDQAEAVADLITSQTIRATRSARRTLDGAFSNKVKLILDSVRKSLYQIEASIDFVDEVPRDNFSSILRKAAAEQIKDLEVLTTQAETGVRLKEGVYVAILGPPNVGKSTLLNCLAGSDKAIVSETPGTTRDPIVVGINVRGLPVHFVDTAGIRATSDLVESTGIDRARIEAEKADVILYVTEARDIAVAAINKEIKDLSDEINGDIVIVRNKIDKLGLKKGMCRNQEGVIVNISAKNGTGVEDIFSLIADSLSPVESSENEFVARQRHIIGLHNASKVLESINFVALERNPELVAEEYRKASTELDVLVGKYTTEEMLGDIFSHFCIGK